jgi:flagellar protein FliS
MHPSRQLQVYRENQIATADPGTVLLKLYDGAIDSLNRARRSLEQGDMAEKGKWLLRAYDIITEFQLALDFDVGGQLAHSLNDLYCFMLEQITVANVKNDPKPLETTVALLAKLQQAWEEAVVIQRKKVAQGAA